MSVAEEPGEWDDSEWDRGWFGCLGSGRPSLWASVRVSVVEPRDSVTANGVTRFSGGGPSLGGGMTLSVVGAGLDVSVAEVAVSDISVVDARESG